MPNVPVLRAYGDFIKSCKEAYFVSPDFHDQRLAKIIGQLEQYSGHHYHVVVKTPLPAPALSMAPNIIHISPAVASLEDSIVAVVMAHEFGHHHYKHMQRGTPVMLAEYEADCYSVGFVEAYGYDLNAAKSYRLNLLKPGDRDDGECVHKVGEMGLSKRDFEVLHAVIGKAFDSALARQQLRPSA